MISLAIKNIWGRKTRSILTILGVVVAMQLFLIMTSIMNSYEKDMQKQISGMAGRVNVQLKTEGAASFFPLEEVIKESDAKKVLDIDGVDPKRSTMALYQSILPPPAPNMPPAVIAVGLEPGKEEAYFGNLEVKGSAHLKDDHDVILGAGVAEMVEKELNKKIGDTYEVKGEEFTIVGILPQQNSLINSSVILPVATAQELFIRPALISQVIITAKNADKAEDLAKSIEASNDKLTASTMSDMKKSVDEMLAGQRMFFDMINKTIVVVAAFIIMIVMVMAVPERKKEIGTLKAVGASRGKILKLILTESLSLSLIGGMLALPASMLFIRLLFGYWYYDMSQWLNTMIVAVVLGVISGLWPAWAAQRVNPLESLRYE